MPGHTATIPQVKCVTCCLRLNTRLGKICLIEQPSLQNETIFSSKTCSKAKVNMKSFKIMSEID